MNTRVVSLFRKEILQSMRDVKSRALIFVAPLLQTFIFGYVVTTDIQHTRMVIADEDNSTVSRQLVREIERSEYFRITDRYDSQREAWKRWEGSGNVLLLNIPRGFGADAVNRTDPARRGAVLQLVVDGSDTSTASISAGYLNAWVRDYASRLGRGAARPPVVRLETRYLYNPELLSSAYMVPGVLVMLLSLITLLLTAMAITRERELGTFEQLIVSPIKSWEMVLGKSLPFLLFGMMDAFLIIGAGVLFFDVPFLGSVWLLALAAFLFVVTCIGIGIMISTFSRTQQQAMLTFFFFLLPAVVLSGFMFPVENMPRFFQDITLANPLRHFLECVRGILLKGNGLAELWPWFTAMAGTALLANVAGILRFRSKWL